VLLVRRGVAGGAAKLGAPEDSRPDTPRKGWEDETRIANRPYQAGERADRPGARFCARITPIGRVNVRKVLLLVGLEVARRVLKRVLRV
jgi:hypothetical protein